MMGAIYFIPLETKIIRIVPRLTSHILAKNINKGRITQAYKKEVSMKSIMLLTTVFIGYDKVY